ncbi:MAG TPA: hypothetical protein PLA64_10730 [Mesotoga infera]|nr:hypothetical protein [Thermotogaceae bacterium]HON28760.1 hypothetical protein [Mesotoga infera]
MQKSYEVLVPTALPMPEEPRNGKFLKLLFLAVKTLSNNVNHLDSASFEKTVYKAALLVDSNRTRASKYIELLLESEFYDAHKGITIAENGYHLQMCSSEILTNYFSFRDFIIACTLTNVRSCSAESLAVVTGLSARHCKRIRIDLVKKGLVRRKERFIQVEEGVLDSRRIRRLLVKRDGKSILIECYQVSPSFKRTTKLRNLLNPDVKTNFSRRIDSNLWNSSNPDVYRLRKLKNGGMHVQLGKKYGYSTVAEVINLSSIEESNPSGLSLQEISEISKEMDGEQSELVMQKIINEMVLIKDVKKAQIKR